MILVDTAIWIDHLRVGDEGLAELLESSRVLIHPFVIGELALGDLRQRGPILGYLHGLPSAVVATDREALHFIETHALARLGIGYIDVHLLASTFLTVGASFWTRDKHLSDVAERLGIAADISKR
ncbi:MAG TPA: type II toxin-antitoxin system VapC family toxin [Beijerinckiaceae bacterium]|nr:type II toxin-antitoxin system VapC family toxin [Beijerinckiaceae bacterium]